MQHIDDFQENYISSKSLEFMQVGFKHHRYERDHDQKSDGLDLLRL